MVQTAAVDDDRDDRVASENGAVLIPKASLWFPFASVAAAWWVGQHIDLLQSPQDKRYVASVLPGHEWSDSLVVIEYKKGLSPEGGDIACSVLRTRRLPLPSDQDERKLHAVTQHQWLYKNRNGVHFPRPGDYAHGGNGLERKDIPRRFLRVLVDRRRTERFADNKMVTWANGNLCIENYTAPRYYPSSEDNTDGDGFLFEMIYGARPPPPEKFGLEPRTNTKSGVSPNSPLNSGVCPNSPPSDSETNLSNRRAKVLRVCIPPRYSYITHHWAGGSYVGDIAPPSEQPDHDQRVELFHPESAGQGSYGGERGWRNPNGQDYTHGDSSNWAAYTTFDLPPIRSRQDWFDRFFGRPRGFKVGHQDYAYTSGTFPHSSY